MSEIRTFLLPDLGEGLTESEVVSWRIAVGDSVTLNQIIAEIETAKAIVELPAPYAGTVARIYAEPGTTVNVGEPLLDIDLQRSGVAAPAGADTPTMPIALGAAAAPGPEDAAPDDAAAGDPAPGGSAPESSAPEGSAPENLVGYGAPADAGTGPVRRARRRLDTEAIAIVGGAAAAGADRPRGDGTGTGTVTGAAERARSTPPVRKLAHELGIDLERLEGSGDGGAITRADVEAAFAGRFESQPAPADGEPAPATAEPDIPGQADGVAGAAAAENPAPGGPANPAGSGATRIPIHGVRKHTAAAMVQSAFTAPHVSCFLTVDVTASLELLAELKAEVKAEQGPGGTEPRAASPGILALTAQAVCIALRRSPELNAHWDDAAQEIVLYRSVHLGIAAATARGLIVPVIPDAQALGLDGLADALATLSRAARAGTTTPAALRGGTFSISNIGVFGVDAGTPILTPGQTGILALGALRREPREWRGEIALRDVVTLSLSFDHRVVDGEQGARFLRDVGAILNNPGRVLGML